MCIDRPRRGALRSSVRAGRLTAMFRLVRCGVTPSLHTHVPAYYSVPSLYSIVTVKNCHIRTYTGGSTPASFYCHSRSKPVQMVYTRRLPAALSHLYFLRAQTYVNRISLCCSMYQSFKARS